MNTYDVNLGHITVEESDSDEVLMQKARNHLPTALRKMGEKAGEETWKTMEGAFRGSLIQLSSSDKYAHVRDIADQFVRNATHTEREDIVQSIFEQLKEERDGKKLS